jgi:uncharacterized protein (DUF302 family)
MGAWVTPPARDRQLVAQYRDLHAFGVRRQAQADQARICWTTMKTNVRTTIVSSCPAGIVPAHSHDAELAPIRVTMHYEHSINLDLPYPQAVARVREALAGQGFGVLTEIDVRATLREKRGLDMEDYLILGACNPDLAHRALDLDRSIGVLLPCNVVISARDGGSTVRIMDPQVMAAVAEMEQLQPIADEAARRLQAVLDALSAA